MKLRFRLLVIVVAALLTPGWPAQDAAAVAPTPLGFHIARGDAAHMQAVRQAGGEFAVVVFSWRDIQPLPDRFYWEVPDAALRAAEFYGVDVMARLDQPPDWALDDASLTPWDLDAYANFSRQVAQRYGGRLAGLILWNEPNLSLEWGGQQPDPAAYAELLRAAYPAVKEVAPDLPVSMAGLASTVGGGDNAMSDLAFLQGVYDAGGGAYFDALAAHPYGFGQLPQQAPAAERLNFRRIELLRAAMEANGDAAKPVWITEMGWRTRAPDPAEQWQVVTPQQQAEYTLAAVDWARRRYPWLAGIGLWELNGVADDYGYALWEGRTKSTPAFNALAQQAKDAPMRADPAADSAAPIEILAPDVAIRLGDIGTLHPHWVHLHRGGDRFSPDWEGEFFLTAQQTGQAYDLVLETMQVDQPTNSVSINGQELGRLRTRTRPDETSTWVTQRLAVPAELLRPGANTLRVAVGLRHPARQYADWRWENMQFRHVRLAQPLVLPEPLLPDWQALPFPGGWAEANLLRLGPAGDLWLTANRPGQVWRDDGSGMVAQSANCDDLVFVDVLPAQEGVVAATDRGLFWRPAGSAGWNAARGAPDAYAYVVAQVGEVFYAGFEDRGLWQASQPAGPWRPAGLNRRTVFDIGYSAAEGLLLATDQGVFLPSRRDPRAWRRLPGFPAPAGEQPARQPRTTVYRLTVSATGDWVAHSGDQLWLWDGTDWQPFGPSDLAGRLFTVLDCCAAGALVGASGQGVWRLEKTGWRRLDDGSLATADIHALLHFDDGLLAATNLGLFQSRTGRSWRPAPGLPPTVSDLVADPANSARSLAATPAGIYRSPDRGQRWELISPPWTVWDLAWSTTGRLFAARSGGVAWADDLGATPVTWQAADGLEGVLFFSVNPHPTDPDILWAGTWGNNVGVSADGGATLAPLHNGLETLSALDVLWHPTPGQATIATIEGLYRTDDSGESWFKLPGPLAQQTVHHLMQTADGAIWVGAADGLWVSRDYGVTWERPAGLPEVTVLRLGAMDLPSGQLLWAGTEEMGLWLSLDGGESWQFGGLAGHSIYNVLPDPQQVGGLIAATHLGLFKTAGSTRLSG